MKRYLTTGILATFILALFSCTGKYILSTKPDAPVYVRPAAPGPDYVWVEGDWRQKKGRYMWFEGHWVKNKANKNWQPGYWTSRNDNWYWRRGHWAVR